MNDTKIAEFPANPPSEAPQDSVITPPPPLPEVMSYTDTASNSPDENSAPDTVEISLSHTLIEAWDFIKRFIPAVLIAISGAVFVSSAAAVIFSSGISAEKITRMMIGDLTGGMKYVKMYAPSDIYPPVPHTDTHETGDESGQAGKSPPDIASPPEENAENGQEQILNLSNETPYTPDMNAVILRERAVAPLETLYAEYGDGSPVVLVIHTHGSEAFHDFADTGYRTEDTEQNVVALGKIITDELNAAGIATVHCETLFDAADFNMAYYNASMQIREYINEYPSISYVIDVHRDSVVNGDGEYIPLISYTNGSESAKMMFVIGTDHGGSGHSGWQDNLALAARLQVAVNEKYPALMRDINLRSASFNEQYTKGSLLIEIGTCANTLDEAKESARVFAEYLAAEIIG